MWKQNSQNHNTDEVTFSMTPSPPAFLPPPTAPGPASEFFLLGRVPPVLTSGHPLFNNKSIRSELPEDDDRAYETQVRPSWSIVFTLAFD